MRGNETGAAVWIGTGVAVGAIAVLHVEGLPVRSLDPLRHTVSDYVALPGGYLLLGLAAGALAFVGAHLTAAAARTGAMRTVTVLLGSWGVAMVVVGIFPTNAQGLSPDLVSEIHRWAGAWTFASLPLAVWLLARDPGVRAADRTTLGRLAVLAGGLSAAFLLSHVPIVIGGSPGFLPLGGVERVLYGVVIVLLIATGRALSPDGFARDFAGETAVDGGPATGHVEPDMATGGAA